MLFAFGTGQAMAACPAPKADATTIAALLSNRYACATRGNESWNELHQSGTVTDYKRGPTDPVDPSTVVGTYAINNSNGVGQDTITYNYGSGGSFTYSISPSSSALGTYTFCNVSTSEVITVTVSASHC